MVCLAHHWTKKRFPCPWLRCPNGARGLWISIGGRKKVVYVRYRTKDEFGPRYDWEKTALNPMDLLATEDETDELVF